MSEVTTRKYHVETTRIHNGKAVFEVKDGFFRWDKYTRRLIKPRGKDLTITYVPVTERGYVKRLKFPVVLREDHKSKTAGIIENRPTFTKIWFTITVRENRPHVYLIHNKEARKFFMRDFRMGSTEEMPLNSTDRILVKEGRRTRITPQQAKELIVKQRLPYFAGITRTPDKGKVWRIKV